MTVRTLSLPLAVLFLVAGCGDQKASRPAKPEPGAYTPGSFTLLSPAPNSETSSLTPSFSWSAQGGALHYTFQLSLTADFQNPELTQSGLTGTSFTSPTALAGGTTYFWRALAFDGVSTKVASNAPYFFRTLGTMPASFALTSPAANATNIAVSNPSFSWAASTGALTYEFQLSPRSDFSTVTAERKDLRQTSFSLLNTLQDGTTYYWRVFAVNGTGRTSSTPSLSSFTTAASSIGIPPQPFTLSSPANGASGLSSKLTLSWNASSDAESYRLEVATDSGFTKKVLDRTDLLGTGLVVTLSYSTTYYWRVTAENRFGTTRATDAPRRFTTKIIAVE